MLEKVLFPEQAGVKTEVIESYLNYLEKNRLKVESFMVIRNGKIACEAYWSPNDETVPHDMYSLSKSITSIAIGIAVDEGYIDLDTKIYPVYFPEKLAKLTGKQKEYAEKLTVHHLLAMRAGKAINVLANKQKKNWLDTFINAPFKEEPGTKWRYVSENAYMLAWILHKETGLTVTEFLTPRLYEPLGIKVPEWERSHQGIEAGGWGLKLTTLDIAKISQVFLDKGKYNGKQIFSLDWYNKCTRPYSNKLLPIYTDKSEYGYQVWIDHEVKETTLRFVGLYGQFSFMFPEENAAVIITARDNRDELLIRPLFNFFPKAFIEPCDKKDENKIEKLNKILSSKYYTPEFKNGTIRNTAKEKEIENKKITLKSLPNLSVIGTTSFFMWNKKCGKFNNVKFNFHEDYLEMSFTEAGCGVQTIKAGMNGQYIRNTLKMVATTVIADAQATWNNDGTLELYFHNTGMSQSRRFIFSFNNGKVYLRTSVNPGHIPLVKFNLGFNNGIKLPKIADPVLFCGVHIFDKCFASPNAIGKY